MNIFVLDTDIDKAVRYHCDKHIVKMLTESVQILSTAAILNNCDCVPYKKTHIHHPCVVWAAASRENYKWLLDFARTQYDEYKYRYQKIHMAGVKMDIFIRDNLVLPYLPSGTLTPPPEAMPEIYRTKITETRTWDQTVEAYRRYYLGEKLKFSKWTGRPVPDWVR